MTDDARTRFDAAVSELESGSPDPAAALARMEAAAVDALGTAGRPALQAMAEKAARVSRIMAGHRGPDPDMSASHATGRVAGLAGMCERAVETGRSEARRRYDLKAMPSPAGTTPADLPRLDVPPTPFR